ncbi:MAG TPA: hypothetical protein VEZ11_04260 [Thermoanaerobaculia bacterium]|nr:hypothetical protein [Thermoanaerobaculia bacterium]
MWDYNRGIDARVVSVIQQLDLNYDLYGMTALEILALLPPEFDAWR